MNLWMARQNCGLYPIVADFLQTVASSQRVHLRDSPFCISVGATLGKRAASSVEYLSCP